MTDDEQKIQAIGDGLDAAICDAWPALTVAAAVQATPSDDWRWCDCCGRVVHVDDWQGDGDECDECAGEA